tara:strand:+ start:4977 stop:5570 length:594 start_codon:yes stop_codon:yes gene_type:complete
MDLIGDSDVWPTLDWKHLWVYDKLILSKKLGHTCGPAGIPVPTHDEYVVRPITNLESMSVGARLQWLQPGDNIEPGYFWCEKFMGEHITVDYNYGKQKTTVKGYPRKSRLDRFDKWELIDKKIPFPKKLDDLHEKEWVNIEMIGGNIIEVHFRYNDDFRNHNGKVIYPVWKDEELPQPEGSIWYDSPCKDRLGHWVI